MAGCAPLRLIDIGDVDLELEVTGTGDALRVQVSSSEPSQYLCPLRTIDPHGVENLHHSTGRHLGAVLLAVITAVPPAIAAAGGNLMLRKPTPWSARLWRAHHRVRDRLRSLVLGREYVFFNYEEAVPNVVGVDVSRAKGDLPDAGFP